MVFEDDSPTIECPHCGHAIYAQARFCRRCGKSPESAAPHACAQCGASGEPDARYCSTCGVAIGSVEPSEHTTKSCPSCGATVPRAAKICGQCNSYLSREPKTSVATGAVSEWFYEKNGQRLGPYSAEAMQDYYNCGELNLDTLVWRDSSGAKWRPLSSTDLVQIGVSEPPPLPPSSIHSVYAWLFALVPIFGAIIVRLLESNVGAIDFTVLILSYSVAYVIFAVFDERQIRNSGRRKGLVSLVWLFGWLQHIYFNEHACSGRGRFLWSSGSFRSLLD